MSKRKDLKKIINNSMALLYTDCVFYSVATKDPKLDKVEVILADICHLQNDLLGRMSISEGKEIKSRTKTYYRKVKEDLKKEVDRIGKKIQDLD